MTDQPRPLREALHRALDTLVEAAEPELASNAYSLEAFDAAASDLRQLIERIPGDIGGDEGGQPTFRADVDPCIAWRGVFESYDACEDAYYAALDAQSRS